MENKIGAKCPECENIFFFSVLQLSSGNCVECEECFTTLEIKECEVRFFPVSNRHK